MKNSRQNLIREIIHNEIIETQEQLQQCLKEHGVYTTQATISRDIKEMHLIKTQAGVGKYRYSIAESVINKQENARLKNIFREAVKSCDFAQNIVVINTMPGLASAACSTLDCMDIPGMVGTLAGDDTGILIMKTTDDAIHFCADIHNLLK